MASHHIVERRKKQDFASWLFILLSLLCWILFIGGLVIFHWAQPEFVTVFDRVYHLKLRTQWDYQYVIYMFYTIAGGFSIALIALFLGRIRGRRKTDYKGHLIFLGVLYVIMGILTTMLIFRISS